MSLHIVVFAPATRVMSRKLGPTWRSASPCSERRAAAWEASTFASTWGRWLKTATSRSCVLASTATGRAPTSTTKRWSRSYSSPPDCSCGVRYQTAPWKRSARACSTPATAIRTPSPAIRQAPGRARCAGASYSRKLLARQLGRRLELAQVRREVVRVERLRAVADGLLRGRVDLHNDPVGAGRGGRERQRLHQRALPGRVARVDHDRQVRELAQNRDRHQVEREAVARLVGSDAALAEHHLL